MSMFALIVCMLHNMMVCLCGSLLGLTHLHCLSTKCSHIECLLLLTKKKYHHSLQVCISRNLIQWQWFVSYFGTDWSASSVKDSTPVKVLSKKTNGVRQIQLSKKIYTVLCAHRVFKKQ